MRAMRRCSFLLLCLVLPSLLIACGGSPSTSVGKASTDKQVFVSPIEGFSDIESVDPALAVTGLAQRAAAMIFTGLVQLDDAGVPQPQLAQSYEQSSDGLTWTFHLRSNLKFNDGTPLTSADVAYSLDRALQPSLKSTTGPTYLALLQDASALNAGRIKTIIGDSVLTPDASTVVLRIAKRDVSFLGALTNVSAFVVEKHLIDQYGAQWTDHLEEGGGAGPFKVSEYSHTKQIVFVPNSFYYGPKPQLRKVVFPFYPAADSSYQAYQSGQLDAAEVPTTQVAAAKALPEHQYHQIPRLLIVFYSLNYLTKPFDNLKIRQAFALAINKDRLIHFIWKDTNVATNHIIPPQVIGSNPQLTGPAGVKSTSGNIALAQQLFEQGMQEEGYTRATLPPITLTVAAAGLSAYSNMHIVIQQMWQQALGVKVTIDAVPSAKLVQGWQAATNNPHGLQMWARGGGPDYPDPATEVTPQFGRGSPSNNENYGQNHSTDAPTQQATQQLIEQAAENLNSSSRTAQYEQIEQQLVNDVAWIPLYQVTIAEVYKPCVTGIVDTPQFLNLPPNDWSKVYISTATPCANTGGY